jgi:hypothetical protein
VMKKVGLSETLADKAPPVDPPTHLCTCNNFCLPKCGDARGRRQPQALPRHPKYVPSTSCKSRQVVGEGTTNKACLLVSSVLQVLQVNAVSSSQLKITQWDRPGNGPRHKLLRGCFFALFSSCLVRNVLVKVHWRLSSGDCWLCSQNLSVSRLTNQECSQLLRLASSAAWMLEMHAATINFITSRL